MFFEESLIFFPDLYPIGDWHPVGVDFEDVSFQSEDRTQLHGWYVSTNQARAHVLFMHGNAGNLSHRAYVLKLLRGRLDVSVFIFDYRGYGKSEGRPDETGILADARAARAWLASRAEVAETQLVLMGRSLGAAVAVDLAAETGAKGLILESAFTSALDLAAHHYPMLPVRSLMRTRLDSLSKIGSYYGPLLQSHGTADEIVPIELGQRLFDAAPGEKEFFIIKDAMHNDPQPPEFYEAMDRFLQKLTKNGASHREPE